jgi:cyclic beta-1,2-glucan synthetase
MYRAGIESILGFQKQGSHLLLNPCIPAQWPGFQIDFRHGSAWYEIVVENPGGVSRGVVSTTLDGVVLPQLAPIALQDDGVRHQVKIVLG